MDADRERLGGPAGDGGLALLGIAQKSAQRARDAGRLLHSLGATLATAESCTGGLIAHRITDVPGCSAYFKGSVVAYDNAVKVGRLGVAEQDLALAGAVSERVALAMAKGARRELRADYAVSTTGVAGPAGGSPQKPVGLVVLAVCGPDDAEVRTHRFGGTRAEVKEAAGEAALDLLSTVLARRAGT